MRPARLVALFLVAVLGPLALATPVLADDTGDAQAQVEQAERDLARYRSEYAVLAEQAHAAEGQLDQSQLRIVNLKRSVDDADIALSDARVGVALRAKRAYMGDTAGNVMAALRLKDYNEIAAYIPYMARPLEEDRRAIAVYQQRLTALRNLQSDVDAAQSDAVRKAGDLSGVEAKLTTNLNAQQDRLAQAKGVLAEAQAKQAAADQAAAAARSASASAGADVPRGPQPGSGPGPGSGIPDPIDVPPAPAALPNGVALGPTAGVPAGMKATGIKISGVASWYGPGFHGHTTANGEVYDQYGFTAASRTLPFDTVLLVSYGDRSVLVRINDRGPYVDDRVLDLSKGSADALGIGGLGYVDAEIIVPV